MVKARSVMCRPSGFTLVEVLVALVVTGLLVSILMGSLYYLFRVQDALRGEIVVREAELRSKAWFLDVLSGCLPAESASGFQFVGTAREITCDTISPLRPQRVTATQRVTIGLRRGANAETEVTYREKGGTSSEPQVIATLPGGDFYFTFAGVKRKEIDHWPPDRNDSETLPRQIRLAVKEKGAQETTWMVSLRADPWLEPVFRNPFGLNLPQ